MNLTTPWIPIILLAVLAVLFHSARGRIAGWRAAALAGLGLAAAAAALVLLRTSPDSAPLAFPWEPALGGSPHWVADPAIFPFAVLIMILLAGVILTDNAGATRWPFTILLAGGALGILFAENLLALALAWLLMEAALRVAAANAPEEAQREAVSFDVVWGFLGLAGILFLWRATDGASLRPYEMAQWTDQARTILTAVALVQMGVYPLTSRRLAFGGPRLSSVDAGAAAPVVAGLALAQRAATLGPVLNPQWLLWLCAVSALICGFLAWHSASERDRVQWVIRAVLGLVLALWGAGAVPPLLLFPSAAAAIVLGLGLWTLRTPPLPAGGIAWRGLSIAAWILPATLLGLGPLSPLTYGMLHLWRHLLGEAVFAPLALALAGQMLAMAALLRPTGTDRPASGSTICRGVYGFWMAVALVWVFWPRLILSLGGDDIGAIAAAMHLPQSLGAWGALALPLIGALALPEPSRIPGAVRVWLERAAAILSLGWLRTTAVAAGEWIGRALNGLDSLLGGEGYLPWTLALLLGLVLWMAW